MRTGSRERPAPDPPYHEWHAALLRAYGPQGWWPGRTRFEIVVGAILTQAVAWTNVEKAIRALRRQRLLRPEAMRRAPPARIAVLIRPAGYFNQKARKLRAFVDFLHREHGSRLEAMFRMTTPDLRQRLLSLPGVGPETADSILLYAGSRPVFVIDAYTRRVLRRHGAARGNERYDELRQRFEAALPRQAPLFNEFHALFVRLAKERCRKSEALCAGCPLEPWLPAGRPVQDRPDRPSRRRRSRRGGRAAIAPDPRVRN